MDWIQGEYAGHPEQHWFARPTPHVRIDIEPGPRDYCEVAIFVRQHVTDLRPANTQILPAKAHPIKWHMVADHVFPKPAEPKREAERIYREWLAEVTG